MYVPTLHTAFLSYKNYFELFLNFAVCYFNINSETISVDIR